MSANEIDAKVKELRELRNLEAELKAAIADVEESLKAAMLLKNTDVHNGLECTVMWKTIVSSRFDSTAFKKAMPELAERFTRSSTSRRFTVA